MCVGWGKGSLTHSLSWCSFNMNLQSILAGQILWEGCKKESIAFKSTVNLPTCVAADARHEWELRYLGFKILFLIAVSPFPDSFVSGWCITYKSNIFPTESVRMHTHNSYGGWGDGHKNQTQTLFYFPSSCLGCQLRKLVHLSLVSNFPSLSLQPVSF